ncbi:MAG TPA: protein kinase, partial [Kofleriaceae bacterium]|nr:protein kinase [Kofleriaceae bacterium]
GGMGVVYRTLDRERGVEVALKTLRGITPESVLRFKAEFRALRDVRHPNLVELGELFENDGTWFFTMELVRGVPLLAWVRGDGASPDPVSQSVTSTAGPAAALDDDATAIEAPSSIVARNAVARQRRIDRLPAPCCDVPRLRAALAHLARGLSALHAAGKVHRDVKPSNILVDGDGRVVLLDFGVVAELRRQSHERLLFGTVKYMAPEQARGDHVGPAADWYAVGVLLFQALAGELPYGNVSHDELLVLKQHVDVPPLAERVDGVPPDLELLVQGLLERDAEKRPTESEILEALGIASDEASNVPLPAYDQLFVGRQAELAELDRALDDSRARLATAIVEGESGVGKSTLVARFVELARGRDPRLVVLHGRCHERERVAFNALDGVVDELTRFLLTQREPRLERLVPADVGPLLAVFPALRAVSVLADAAALARPVANVRARAFGALRELFVRLCRRRATVLVIEDLQWADQDSCALLGELVRGDDEPPRLCLVATKRPHEGDAVLAHLGSPRRIALAGLAPRDAEELVYRVAASAGAHAPQIIAETRGHPLFIRELARQPVMMRLDEAIWARASRLEPGAQQLLAAVAVAGSPIPRHVVATMTGTATAELEAHVAALTRESLVRVHGPADAGQGAQGGRGAQVGRGAQEIEPFHDRIREAVLAHQPFERQRELQHALARALEVAGAPAAQLLAR